ncbi:ROK family transcriptional regulator [Pontibacter korlensis]|uniref:Transcriptional regulator n=1 Tax=Pontibacter korlensis TaxID=400092 RepID=A0A0E3UZH8_9BACT|nr:ROK family transcriptional regulator [Pontibacter korlensis]AKD05366.1 transcriptional regulator [Pontibacter korlensis]
MSIRRKTFLEELGGENITGVAYKNVNQKKSIISYFANIGNATIAELCKELNLSAPKVTNLVNDLITDGLVQDYGKIESTGGRKPNLYGLTPDSGFFLGVDVKNHSINIGLTDLQKNLVKIEEHYPYKLSNDEKSLKDLCSIINMFIKDLPIPKSKIMGVGINLSGRISYATGYSYSFFHFHEDPLSRIIESQVGIRVFLENDSRAMAYGEFSTGVDTNHKHVLFLNLDHGLGSGIIINGQLYYGKSGYSGEFGHMPVFDNEILCHCGKRGCLETEASGWALVRMFREKVAEGSSTLVMRDRSSPESIMLEDIINAANNDDVLAIELIAQVGEKIGRSVAALINIFNPELVILGGSLAATQEYIRLPVKSAVNRYSLSLVNNDTQFQLSRLGNRAGVIGACLLARNRLLDLA